MRRVGLLLVLAIVGSACAGNGAGEGSTGAGPGAEADFLSITLTDVRTGEPFTLGGFDGKVTFFIAMAVW